MPDIDFDADAVVDALKNACRNACTELARRAPDESAYGLMLYNGCIYGYICVTLFTDEGLERTLDSYRRGPLAHLFRSGEADREGLRWGACDSPYHALARVTAPPLLTYEVVMDDEDSLLDNYEETIHALCVQALLELDIAGFYGERRNEMTLTVLTRDESESDDDWRSMVYALNPPEVTARWERLWAIKDGLA